jgi:hypothetical protein
MATIWRKVDYTLEDYFMRNGFEEGTDGGFGYEYRNEATKILNRHLLPFGITVSEDDSGGSSHNNCRIEFNDPDTRVDFQSIDADNGWDDVDTWAEVLDTWDEALKHDGRIDRVATAQNKKKAKQIVKAIANACAEFETVAKDDMAQVIDCPDADLPLLVGHIENETALKILDWRLKGAS